MSDARKVSSGVTALVLSTGESTTDASIASVRAQSLPVDTIIVVRDVRPFHRALNSGVAQVTTPFFLQVDADMLLDPSCVARLRRAMRPDVGIAVGLLRDDLVELVVGIKLFRTACFANFRFGDSISPDTDFVDRIAIDGWRTVYVGRRRYSKRVPWQTLGAHRPDYSPLYTYRKHLLEGERYRYRQAIGGFKAHLRSLELSKHPSALFARVGLARGFFRQVGVDALGRGLGDDEFARLSAFLAALPDRPLPEALAPSPDEAATGARFGAYFRRGRDALRNGDRQGFSDALATLNASSGVADAWILQLALFQGLLASRDDDERLALAACEEFVPSLRVTRSGGGLPLDDDVEDAASYARAKGLRRFVLAGRGAAEYRAATKDATYNKSTASVAMGFDARGRQRLKLPFRPLGHIVALDAERLDSLVWLLDLAKSGFAFVHVPGALGAYRRFLPAVLAEKSLERVGWRWGASKVNQDTRALSGLAELRPPSYAPVARRVLMVSENLVRGGSERQMVAAVKGLLDRGFEVKVLALTRLDGSTPTYAMELADLGVAVQFGAADMPNRRPRLRPLPGGLNAADAAPLPLWLSCRLVEVLQAVVQYQPAVIHGWLDGPGVTSALAGCLMGVPRIVIQQGSLAVVRRGRPQSAMLRRAYAALVRNPTVTIINNSAAGARDNEAWLGLPSGAIGVVRNGLVAESSHVATATAAARFRAQYRIAAEAQVVGTVMRFVPEKDPELWLETAAAIAGLRPAVRFLICGFGPLEARLRARILELELTERVVLAGAVTDAGLAYSAMDVVLLTSVIEGLPNVMIEAQAVGRPVVTTNVGGTTEAVLAGVTGTVIEERSAGPLAAAVIAALDDPQWRETVVTEGPRFVAARFGLDRMVEETIAVYRSFDGVS